MVINYFIKIHKQKFKIWLLINFKKMLFLGYKICEKWYMAWEVP